MSVARWREHAKQGATRRVDMLPTYPCEGSTSLRDRLRSERPPAAVLECGEQPRAGRFMLETRARSVLMIEPAEGAILFPTWLATTRTGTAVAYSSTRTYELIPISVQYYASQAATTNRALAPTCTTGS